MANDVTFSGKRYVEYMITFIRMIFASLLGEIFWFVENLENAVIGKYINFVLL